MGGGVYLASNEVSEGFLVIEVHSLKLVFLLAKDNSAGEVAVAALCHVGASDGDALHLGVWVAPVTDRHNVGVTLLLVGGGIDIPGGERGGERGGEELLKLVQG